MSSFQTVCSKSAVIIDYRVGVCRITKVAHIEHLYGMYQKLGGVLFYQIKNIYILLSQV